MQVKELIAKLQQLPQEDEIAITAMDDHFFCTDFDVAAPKEGGTQEIILNMFIGETDKPKEVSESLTAKLNSKFNLKMKEDFEDGEVYEMAIVSFGKDGETERFELDGIEFYKADDEELQSAVDTCIEMEFFSDWQEDGVTSYNIDSIEYDEEDGIGTAYVSLFTE